MKKSRCVSPKSQKKMSSRRAAAAAVVSLGAGVLGTQSAEAGIVTIDLTNVNGVNFTGQNAGLTVGNSKSTIISFGGARQLQFNVLLFRGVNTYFTGPSNNGNFNTYGGIANSGSICTPLIYTEGASVGGPVNNFNSNLFYTPNFRYEYSAAPTFDGYLGFLSSPDGGNPGVYGWIKATWNGTNFQFYSAAYESTPGVAIRAGDTGVAAVPEPTTMAVFGLGALVLGAGKVRKQRAARRQKQAEALSV
jgi:hypothetical protein